MNPPHTAEPWPARQPTVLSALKAACPSIREHEPLSRYTTLHIGGPADYFAEVPDAESLGALLKAALALRLPWMTLGAGSNVLFSDGGRRGLVLRLGRGFQTLRVEGEVVVAGAGLRCLALVRQCAEQGLGGVEFLTGVPGTVGGAIRMNAGTGDGEIGDRVDTVTVLLSNGTLCDFSRDAVGFGYRASRLPEGGVIVSARLRLVRKPREQVVAVIQAELDRRKATQPVAEQNAGCMFKNPPGRSAGALIDQAGLKGRRVGAVEVSALHGNFFNNLGGATASDVLALIAEVQSVVLSRHGISLEPEIIMAPES